jgi:hypothetical protein
MTLKHSQRGPCENFKLQNSFKLKTKTRYDTNLLYGLALLLILFQNSCFGQVKRNREREVTLQMSLFPGISTNGIESTNYINKYSFNLFGGLSAGNKVFEAGLITNSNTKSVTGIQLAGLGNIIGTNTFQNLTPTDRQKLLDEGVKSDFAGIQFAGFLNYVRNDFKGIQISGGFNNVGGKFKGFQVAGIGNSVGGEYVSGIQIGSLYNFSNGSVVGMQISTLFNYCNGELLGLQAGLINRTNTISGKKSTPPTSGSGIQIGLMNFSKSMDGLQIGLINFGGNVRGKQIGLLNFFNKGLSKENTRSGTPIGLLNFGTTGSFLRVSFNEVYNINLEVSTGNCLNCTLTQSGMPYNDRNRIFNQNILIFGVDHQKRTWAFGYGFQKVLYNKASMLPRPENEKRMLNYGIKFMQLNNTFSSLNRSLNLLTKMNVDLGIRLGFCYLFAGVSLNFGLKDAMTTQPGHELRSLEIANGTFRHFDWSISPGYQIGLQLSKIYRPNF